MLQYVLVGIAIISILAAVVIGIVWLYKHLDFHQKIDLANKNAERDINIEQLRIRANPNLYNVELTNV